jgi:hypothetical protein
MEHLLKNVVQFLDDFLPVFGRKLGPDLACRDLLVFGHNSYSFTRERNSSTADRESFPSGASRPNVKRLVAARGMRSTMPSR